jgi:hypothetical protein
MTYTAPTGPPVIDPTTSVLGYRQFQTWAYQPSASGFPYSWSCDNLPSGLAIDDQTTQSSFTSDSTANTITVTADNYVEDSLVYFSVLDQTATEVGIYHPYRVNYITNTDLSTSTTTFTIREDIPDSTPIDIVTSPLTGKVGHLPTGLIQGAAQVAGIYECDLICTNMVGTTPTDSDSITLTIGIEEAAPSSQASNVGIIIDLGTLLVSSPDLPTVTSTSSSSGSTTQGPSGGSTPVLYAKENDDVTLSIQFVKKEQVIDLNLVSLKFAIKEFEPDVIVTLGGGTDPNNDFEKKGAKETAYYLLPVHFGGDALAGALSDWEEDIGTLFEALGEIEWIEQVTWNGALVNRKRTCKTFFVTIERDLIQP